MSTSISELMKSMGAANSEGSTSASKMMPFGTKTEMVEIVPLQSVTITSNDGYTSPTTIDANGKLIVGAKYTVVMDGIPYNVTCIDDDGATLGDKYENLFKEYPFNIYQGGEYDPVVILTPSEGTYTFAIYEEQEIVTPIDPKFVGASGGGATILYTDYKNSANRLFHDEDCTIMVTRNELIELITKGIILCADFNSEGGGTPSYHTGFTVDDEGDYAQIRYFRDDKTEWYYTSEYVNAGPQ